MKKLFLFLMATAFCIAPSCTSQDDMYDVVLPDPSDITVTIQGVSDSDTGVFGSRYYESQSFYVLVDANESLYPDATGSDLKSYSSSSTNFTVSFNSSTAVLTVTPIGINYTDEDLDGVLTVVLSNEIGGASTSIDLTQLKPTYTTMTFESDQTIDPDGAAVAVGDYTITYCNFSDYTTYDYTYENIYLASESYDDILFQSADSRVQFGQYFSPSEYGDYWAGFALSSNYGADTTVACDYLDQFTAFAFDDDANCDGTFAVAYYSGSSYGSYDMPAITFSEATTVSSLSVGNILYTRQYEKTYLSTDTDLYLTVVLTPSLNGETFLDEDDDLLEYREYLIANDTTKLNEWISIEMYEIGDIDRIDISLESNDYQVYNGVRYIVPPAYVAIDNIKYVSEW